MGRKNNSHTTATNVVAAPQQQSINWVELLPHLETLVVSSRSSTNPANSTTNYRRCASTSLKILSSRPDESGVVPPLPEDVRSVLSQIYVRSLLKTNSFETAYEFCRATLSSSSSSLCLEEAYALYRLKRYEASLKVCEGVLKNDHNDHNSSDAIGGRRLAAQCLYRLHRTNEAVDLYYDTLRLLDQDEDEAVRFETTTNVLACRQSTYDALLPWSDDESARLEDLCRRCPAPDYDLYYNWGTYLVLSATGTAQRDRGLRMLRRALAELEDENEEEEDMDDERAPLQANLAYGLLVSGGGEADSPEAEQLLESLVNHHKNDTTTATTTSTIPASAKTSAQHNLAVYRLGTESLFDSWKRMPDHNHAKNTNHPCTPHMMRNILHNRALLLLKMGREPDCREILQHLKQGNVDQAAAALGTTTTDNHDDPTTTITTSKKKPKKKPPPRRRDKSAALEVNREATVWRAKFVEAELLSSNADAVDEPHDPFLRTEWELWKTQLELRETKKKKKKNDDTTTDLYQPARAYLERTYDDTASPLYHKPAVLATLLSMYREEEEEEERKDDNNGKNNTKASDLLSSYSLDHNKNNNKALGEYYIKMGMYQEAVQLFEDTLQQTNDDDEDDDDRQECMALLVVALSYLDADAAEEKLLLLGGDENEDKDEDENVLDAEELELRNIPWTSSSHKDRILKQARGGDKGQKSKKSQAAVLRARARRREAHLEKLAEQGKYNPDRPSKPDPERWIPKRQRSTFRGRRKNRHYGRGTNHQGMAGVEDARLDARARANDAVNNPPTNAAPSSKHMSVSTGGGNLKKKGGRKR